MEPKKYSHNCLYCGKLLERKRFDSGRLEDFGVFKKRKYCNNDCYKKGRMKEFVENHHNQENRCAHATARNISQYFLDMSKCEVCGKEPENGKKLDIHHKDGNYTNNDVSNLQPLCRSCHMKMHKQNSVCIICGKKQKGHGFCNKHLIRLKKWGCPFFSKFYTSNECKKCDRSEEKVKKCLEINFEKEKKL